MDQRSSLARFASVQKLQEDELHGIIQNLQSQLDLDQQGLDQLQRQIVGYEDVLLRRMTDNSSAFSLLHLSLYQNHLQEQFRQLEQEKREREQRIQQVDQQRVEIAQRRTLLEKQIEAQLAEKQGQREHKEQLQMEELSQHARASA